LVIPSVAWLARYMPNVTAPLDPAALRRHMNLPQVVSASLAPEPAGTASVASFWEFILSCFLPRDRAKERSLLGGRASPREIMDAAMMVPHPVNLKAIEIAEDSGAASGSDPETNEAQGATSSVRFYGAGVQAHILQESMQPLGDSELDSCSNLAEAAQSMAPPRPDGTWRWDALALSFAIASSLCSAKL